MYKLNRDDEGLTARERQVLLGIRAGMAQPEIGEMLGVTKQRVSQIIARLKAKEKLLTADDGSCQTE